MLTFCQLIRYHGKSTVDNLIAEEYGREYKLCYLNTVEDRNLPLWNTKVHG